MKCIWQAWFFPTHLNSWKAVRQRFRRNLQSLGTGLLAQLGSCAWGRRPVAISPSMQEWMRTPLFPKEEVRGEEETEEEETAADLESDGEGAWMPTAASRMPGWHRPSPSGALSKSCATSANHSTSLERWRDDILSDLVYLQGDPHSHLACAWRASRDPNLEAVLPGAANAA